jgi:hypothetical protein
LRQSLEGALQGGNCKSRKYERKQTMVGKERDECINTMKRILDSENERINTAGRGASLAAFELLSDIFPLSSLFPGNNNCNASHFLPPPSTTTAAGWY